MEPNPTNTCVSCLRSRIDITEGIARQVSIHRCRRCARFCAGQSFVACELESKELMALCLKRLKLRAVKVVDAAWVWTEEHSMRLKLKLTVQKEVATGAAMQQTFQVEFVIRNQQCPDCHASFAISWRASVQVRQRVDHKRTFFYLEQVILKRGHAAVKLEQFRGGLDFYFKEKNDAIRFVNFLEDTVPCRVKNSKKLVTADLKSNVFVHQFTALVELAPACKDDLLLLEPREAKRLNMPRLCLVRSVHQTIKLVADNRKAELNSEFYFRAQPRVVLTSRQLAKFVVLDAEGRDVVVAKPSELGITQVSVSTHLKFLQAGDEVLGFDLRTANLPASVSISDLPDVVVVRKAPPDPSWHLKRDTPDNYVEDEGEPDYDIFVQQLQTDRDMRANVNVYKSKKTVSPPPSEPDNDPDAVRLEELLDDFEIGDDHPYDDGVVA
ncbi:hypothetical protein CTAYLR_002612 [Chrysophaeum taylorii]|uniref:60S ribosomal export protein NMD3 n=1 Tax=Chrysophaeum taylorii TaxID=2483200 RepID=A0AAD7XLI2_9STRA|nr:hypothetical protein CTAYLR_002612 [Chrysophaeum taylorii]